MSLSSDDLRPAVAKPLRTSDQYYLWKARITHACWSAARRDIFTVSDENCVDNINAVEKGESKHDWVSKCWTLLIGSIHDEVLMKVSHIEHGHIASLLAEVRATLLINSVEDVQSLRVELCATTMEKCGNDLQTYISTIIQQRDKLAFLDAEVPQLELVYLFVRALHPVFQTMQLYCAVPGQGPTSFNDAVDMARKYATNPSVYSQLNKLKTSGLSQSMFLAAPDQETVTLSKEKPYCHKFLKFGSCTYGEKCKFQHVIQSISQWQIHPRQVEIIIAAHFAGSGATARMFAERKRPRYQKRIQL